MIDAIYSLPGYSCWYCQKQGAIPHGTVPYFGVLGKPMCEPCRAEFDQNIAQTHSQWAKAESERAQADCAESRSMSLIRQPRVNIHD